jgi:Skp family chaperone for outer membrane proteins
MKHNLVVPALALVAMATIGTGVASAQAHDSKGMFAKAFTPTVEMKAKMEKKMEDRLTQLVTNGKITDQQKSLILAKQKELASQHEAKEAELANKTPAERKESMDQMKAELEQWAKDNGIDTQYIMPFKFPGSRNGMRHGGEMRGQKMMRR